MRVELEAQPDADLWTRVADDADVAAFRCLHARHVDRVYRHCYARLGSRPDAEEAANQTFAEAWSKRRRVRVDDAGLLPWLLVVAGNVARNHARAQRRRLALNARLPEGRPDSFDVDARVDAQRTTAALRVALLKLPAEAQRLIGLCVIEGLTYDEAALALGVPVGTIRSRLSRAKARLRRELDKLDVSWGEET